MFGLLPVLNVLATVLVGYSLMFLVPLGFALTLDHSDLHGTWAKAMALTLGSGLLLMVLTRRHRRELMPRDGFLLVNLVWLVLPAFSAIPLLLAIDGLS